jgi:hypothetical protein
LKKKTFHTYTALNNWVVYDMKFKNNSNTRASLTTKERKEIAKNYYNMELYLAIQCTIEYMIFLNQYYNKYKLYNESTLRDYIYRYKDK